MYMFERMRYTGPVNAAAAVEAAAAPTAELAAAVAAAVEELPGAVGVAVGGEPAYAAGKLNAFLRYGAMHADVTTALPVAVLHFC